MIYLPIIIIIIFSNNIIPNIFSLFSRNKSNTKFQIQKNKDDPEYQRYLQEKGKIVLNRSIEIET